MSFKCQTLNGILVEREVVEDFVTGSLKEALSKEVFEQDMGVPELSFEFGFLKTLAPPCFYQTHKKAYTWPNAAQRNKLSTIGSVSDTLIMPAMPMDELGYSARARLQPLWDNMQRGTLQQRLVNCRSTAEAWTAYSPHRQLEHSLITN